MKKFIALLLAVIFVLSVYGIAEEKPTIVATTYPLYDIAKSVAGDRMNVIYAPENAQEHAADCDIVFALCEETDPWTKEISNVKVIYALEGIEIIDGVYDVFTVPVNLMLCSSYFADSLCMLDMSNQSYYYENYMNYFLMMSEIDNQYRQAVTQDMTVYSNDGTMLYLAIEYGVNVENTDEAYLLSTYNYPSEDDLAFSYADLMMRNVEILQNK
ncbi:MAG: zinc ABC transporter substrate-binding protein [Clostridia bacterium]|nr:zinc ABC transporter substrate-binding protein [Clostridia bacterium]MBQ9857279.1 zinc ABC transporter substrate-binding protein [Clostridia bacterium]